MPSPELKLASRHSTLRSNWIFRQNSIPPVNKMENTVIYIEENGEDNYNIEDTKATNTNYAYMYDSVNQDSVQTQKPYKCDICNHSFLHGTSLRHHMLIHLKQKPYQCSICGKAFRQKSNLTTHKNIHSGEKPYECYICHKTFVRLNHLQRHIQSHTGEKPHSCAFCRKQFTKKAGLANHMHNQHPKEAAMQCSFCYVVFASEDHLEAHYTPQLGAIDSGGPTMCTICGRKLCQEKFLSHHVELMHTSKRQRVECTHCGKELANKNSLRVHMYTHTGKKACQCQYCGRMFAYKDACKKHEAAMHLQERQLKCPRCDRSFTRKANLQNHMQIHTAERSLQCTICDKTYKVYNSLQRHLKVHQQEKPHGCPECGCKFRFKNALRRHMLDHHPDKKSTKISRRIKTHTHADTLPEELSSQGNLSQENEVIY